MKLFPWIAAVALVLVHLGLAVRDFKPAGTVYGPGGSLMEGLDFSMRRNEAACVLRGINPYDVWTKKVEAKPFYPFVEKPAAGFTEPVNAYTPWEYVVVMPYALLPKQVGWCVHWALLAVCFLAVCTLLARAFGPWSAIAALLFVIPVNVDFNTGNFALIICLATLLLLGSLERGKALFAGLLLGLTLIKPQMVLLLAIPLAWRRRWSVGFIAGGLCCLLALVPSVLCGVSPVTLALQAPAASAHGFSGCALMPAPLLAALKPVLSPSCCMGIAMALGVCLVAALTFRLRRSESWLVFALPALLCSVAWTYIQPHGFVLTMPVAAVLAADMARNRSVGRLLLGVPAILLLARCARGAEIVVERFLPSLLPAASLFCALSASLAILLASVYVVRYADTLAALRPFRWGRRANMV